MGLKGVRSSGSSSFVGVKGIAFRVRLRVEGPTSELDPGKKGIYFLGISRLSWEPKTKKGIKV